MIYTQEIIDELNILALYDLSTTHEGIKVHKNAAPEAISATQRLYKKGLISQSDGGYLTHLGLEVAQHAQAVLTILQPMDEN